MGECDGENDTNSSWPNDGVESFIKINDLLLIESTEDQTCLMAIESTVPLEFVMKNPFAENDVCIGRGTHKIPCTVGNDNKVTREPVRVFERTLDRLRDG